MRAQSAPSLTKVSPVAGSMKSGIQGNVCSSLKVERPSSSPPDVRGTVGATARALGAFAFVLADEALHEESRLERAQPANARMHEDETDAAGGRRGWFGEGAGFFIVKSTAFSLGRKAGMHQVADGRS